MNIEGLDALDNKILDTIKDNARLSYSDIGTVVGLSRVAVKNRMDAMEKKGVIRGYQTVIDNNYMPTGVHFMLDVEATAEKVQYILEVLCGDPYIRQVYSTTGNCRFHCEGYAPNNVTLDSHVRYLYNHTEGIRRMECHIIMATYMDVDGGVEYVRYQESEHLESKQRP